MRVASTSLNYQTPSYPSMTPWHDNLQYKYCLFLVSLISVTLSLALTNFSWSQEPRLPSPAQFSVGHNFKNTNWTVIVGISSCIESRIIEWNKSIALNRICRIIYFRVLVLQCNNSQLVSNKPFYCCLTFREYKRKVLIEKDICENRKG